MPDKKTPDILPVITILFWIYIIIAAAIAIVVEAFNSGEMF